MTETTRVQTTCLLILTAIATGTALYFLRPVMVPFVLALFFSFALRPVIDLFVRRLRMPTSLALLTTILIGVVLLVLLGLLVSESIQQLTANADFYKERLRGLVDWVRDKLPDRLLDGSKSFGEHLDERGRAILIGGANSLFGLVSDGVLILIFMIFLVAGHKPSREPEPGMWGEVEHQVKTYISTKFMVSALTGFLVGVTLGVLGIPMALVFGLFSFLLNFIPNLGSIIAALLPVPVVFLSPDISTGTAIAAIAIPAAIQFAVGNVIEPKIMGSAVDLHPVTVLMSLIFWGMIWGFTGMLLSTPLTATLRIVLDRSDLTRPAGDLLAGRRPGD